MNFNYNFEEPSNIQTFGDLKNALKERFDELFSKGYLYKGDMGETPQIVNRPLIERFDDKGNVIEWSALGKSIIGEIFKDVEKYKGYYKDGEVVDIDDLIGKLTEDGKLNGLSEAASLKKPASSSTYPWWCADGNSKYPIYPATYFVYIDSTPRDIRNKDKDWEDNSCILIPAQVEYNDYRDDAPAEELEPIVTYHKNHIYPTFYFDSNAKGASTGAWCWKINDVETGIPASVANDDGSVLGHMFIFKNEDGVYKYKAGVNSNAAEDWMTMEEMKKANLRYPIKGDIGFTIEEVKETGDNPTTTETTGDASTPTVTNINTLQIYNFVEDAGDKVNGGAWGRGGNLISFGESFYKALWEFISSDSGVEINNGKIILGTASGNHCIFVKKNGEDSDQTLVLMPYQGDPSEKTDFVDNDIWKEAKLQINYPETKFVNDVSINGNLNTSIITSKSINNDGDISCKSINASGDISIESSISCNEITSNNLVVKDNEIIIGSNKAKVNIMSGNFNVTNTNIDTKLPFNSNNNIKIYDSGTPDHNIQIHSEDEVKTVIGSLGGPNSTSKDKIVTYLSGDIGLYTPTSTSALSIEYALDATGASSKDHTVIAHYKSRDFDISPNTKSISLVMPNSLGITIAVKGENKNGSWPYLSGGSITIKIMASDGTELCSRTKTISENKGGGFGTTPVFKYCTIYCSFTSTELATASQKIIENKYAYNHIYITADVTFDLKTTSGIWGQKSTIYKAGSSCKLSSCTPNSSGESMWSSGTPANSNKDILTANITTLESSAGVAKTSQVHICSDGILIGKAKNNSAIFYIDDKGFNIKYYWPGSEKAINILSISSDSGSCTSDVFALKSEIPKSS